MEEKNEIKLKVAQSGQDDVGKGVVRIDTSVMKKMGISPGDIIEITGGKSTVAIADRAYPADIGLEIIRMDNFTRWNAKAGIGENVLIKKAEYAKANSITIAPAQKNVQIQVSPEIVKQSLLGRAVMKGDMITLGGAKRRRATFHGSPFEDIFKMFEDDFSGGFRNIGFMGDIKFVVVNTNPKGAVFITDTTNVNVSHEAVAMDEKKIPQISYEDIGGLGDVVSKIREMVEVPLKHPKIFETLGIEPPKGVLLYGPPGTGKTLLAKAVANEAEAYFHSIAGPEIMSKWVGEAEKKLRKIFEDAEKNSPTIIFIDEIDAIAPKREEVSGEVERRVVAQLLALMDGLKSRGRVVVIAATNRPNSIDPALRRPGRFDREVEIGIPDTKGRLEILKIHTRNMPLIKKSKKAPGIEDKIEIKKEVDLKKLADITHGFVGADLSALCKEAAMSVLRRILSEHEIPEEGEIPKEILEKLIVNSDDFKEALKLVRPSTLREVLIETPKISWDDVGGLEQTKNRLKESIEWPLKDPKAFSRMGIKAPKGILLTGPPGCGKTLLAKAVAKESEANFISVKGPEIFSKWVGESEKAIREIFRKARQAAPCIVFFDELDSLAPRRGNNSGSKVTEQVVAQLLTEMDGLEDLADVVILAATNRPDIIDSALLRPGRFDRVIVVPAPDKESRKKIFEVHTKNMPVDIRPEEITEIDTFLKEKGESIEQVKENMKFLEFMAMNTGGYSGADIESLCREAALQALRENMNAKEINLAHFIYSLGIIKPSLSKKDTEIYEKFMESVKTQKIDKPANYFG